MTDGEYSNLWYKSGQLPFLDFLKTKETHHYCFAHKLLVQLFKDLRTATNDILLPNLTLECMRITQGKSPKILLEPKEVLHYKLLKLKGSDYNHRCKRGNQPPGCANLPSSSEAWLQHMFQVSLDVYFYIVLVHTP